MKLDFNPTLASTSTENILAMQKRYLAYAMNAKSDHAFELYEVMLEKIRIELESRGITA